MSHNGERYNIFASQCPSRQFFERLADKWTLLIVGQLRAGPVRFNQLRRDVEGITQKVLSQTLKKLERDGLIHRKVTPTVPITVEYSLTPMGHTLLETVAQLADWVESHMEEMHTAQQRYDAQTGGN